jgi:hypothetical protein
MIELTSNRKVTAPSVGPSAFLQSVIVAKNDGTQATQADKKTKNKGSSSAASADWSHLTK